MKKFICATIVLTLLFGTAGCGENVEEKDKNEKSINCMVYSVLNDENSIFCVESDDLWNSSRYTRETAEENARITVFGEMYEGIYDSSKTVRKTSRTDDVYKVGDGRVFHLDSITGEVTRVSVPNYDYFSVVPFLDDQIFSEEDAAKLALQYAEEFIDVEEFEMEFRSSDTEQWESEEDNEKVGEMTLYTFQFMKKANGIDTCNFMNLVVTSKGTFFSCRRAGINEPTELSALFKTEVVDAAIEKKIKEACDAKGCIYQDMVITDREIAVTEGKEQVLLTTAEINIKLNGTVTTCLIQFASLLSNV